MWGGGGGPQDFHRLLAALLAGEELPEGGGQGFGIPTAMVVDAGARGNGLPGRPGVSGQILLMSIPGMGIVGTGVPQDAEGGISNDSIGRAMRTAMEQVLRVVMEHSLEEQQLAHATPPASETLRDALPRVVITKQDQLDATDPKCAICLEDYKIGAKATRMLCGHLFCTSCIREWLRTANSCPICRFELATDRQEYEPGRLERMRGRKMHLKSGELRMMRVPELKKLMRALRISGEGCVEKADLVRRLGEAPEVELAADRQDVFYEEAEVRDMELSLLRNLMERHCLPKLPDNMSEEEERNEAVECFRGAGWISKPEPAAVEAPEASGAAEAPEAIGEPEASQSVVVTPEEATGPATEEATRAATAEATGAATEEATGAATQEAEPKRSARGEAAERGGDEAMGDAGGEAARPTRKAAKVKRSSTGPTTTTRSSSSAAARASSTPALRGRLPQPGESSAERSSAAGPLTPTRPRVQLEPLARPTRRRTAQPGE